MESLIHHYDKTLKAWLERFLINRDKAKKCILKDFVKCGNFI